MPATPIRDYWPKFYKKSLWITAGLQIFLALVVGGALFFSGAITDSIALAFIVGSVAFGAVGINIILISVITNPTKGLIHALTHAANEPTTTTPPNPNARAYSSPGYRDALQLIYRLSSSSVSDKKTGKSSKSGPAIDALNVTSTGLVVMSVSGKIIYHNNAAPIRETNDGSPALSLIFNDNNTIDAWIIECEERSVHAEKTWSRISDKLPGEEGRRIFDIVASYQKGSRAEVVLTIIDRTSSYMPEEDDLDFIAFAAHELRGPITVIRGYLDVLGDELDETLQDDQRLLLERLVVSSNRLSSYVNNILNASRFDRRHLKVHLAEHTVADLYDIIAVDMKMRADAQRRLLSVNFPDNLPTVAADPGSISEVMGNLIDNAIKYSSEGGQVFVSAHIVGDFVEIAVQDNGIGMPSNVVSNLFHKFYRSHRSRETVAGTGIGLYISKAFVESHGGTISVKSVEGEGSTFSFTLPVYATVADKIKAGDNSNQGLLQSQGSWISNHGRFRG